MTSTLLEEARSQRVPVTAVATEQPTPFPVEFLGWLPAFLNSGNCGSHPQFQHTATPPPGYCFTYSPPAALTSTSAAPPTFWARCTRLPFGLGSLVKCLRAGRTYGWLRCWSTLFRMFWLVLQFLYVSRAWRASAKFVWSRQLKSQVLMPRDVPIVFLTSVPYTLGQTPWVIEIEDPTTLFLPFIPNGTTANIDFRQSPYFPMVRAMLESSACRGIVTHMRSTAEAMPKLFRSPAIDRKISYAALGVPIPQYPGAQANTDGLVHLLFTNSWHQMPIGFYLRGGLDVLEAFEILRHRFPNLRLTIRSSIPPLEERYFRIIEEGWVRVINRFTPAQALETIQQQTSIFLLPAARIHVVSVLQAMAHGQAVVVSDGWGMDEYVTAERNGLVVRGRHNKVSWMDDAAGTLREDYCPMHKADPVVVAGLVQAVTRLMEEPGLRQRLGQAARQTVAEQFTVSRWNRGLQQAFDRARSEG